MKPIKEDFSVKKEDREVTSISPKFVSADGEVLPPEAKLTHYDKSGYECDPTRAIAIRTVVGGKATHKALIANGSLYNPADKTPLQCRFVAITEACFSLYLQFLLGKSHHDYEKAVRQLRNS